MAPTHHHPAPSSRAVTFRSRWVAFALYVALSIALMVVLFVDPLIDRPSGLVKLSWFTKAPLSHGMDPCSWDYEGSWRIGFARGNPDPQHLKLSAEPVITCATLANFTAASFVADPFLYIPTANNGTASSTSPGFNTSVLPSDATGLISKQPWFAFYEMKNLKRYLGELGVAVSYDSGASWQHLGTAVSEPFHLSFPLVLWDADSQQYLMFAETIGSKEGNIWIYGTSREAFPFGWRVVRRVWPEDPGWPSTRRWVQFGVPAQ
jgi:hypothetical protein